MPRSAARSRLSDLHVTTSQPCEPPQRGRRPDVLCHGEVEVGSRSMAGKKEAARHAVRAALDSWSFRAPPRSVPAGRVEWRSFVQSGVRTELSTTVFSAEPEEWVNYLTLPAPERYEHDVRVRAHRHRGLKLVAFE